jgi:hypothetical protein
MVNFAKKDSRFGARIFIEDIEHGPKSEDARTKISATFAPSLSLRGWLRPSSPGIGQISFDRSKILSRGSK